MTHADLEAVYEALANRLDKVGSEKTPIFLAKLVLLLAHDLGDAARVQSHIAAAAEHLNA